MLWRNRLGFFNENNLEKFIKTKNLFIKINFDFETVKIVK